MNGEKIKERSVATAISFYEIHKDKVEKKHAEKLDPHYDKELYNLGTEWALAKKDINSNKYKNNKSFLNGYARGVRLLLIEKMEKMNQEGKNNESKARASK